MDLFGDALTMALSELSNPAVLLMILAGTFIGLLFGVIPGLQTVTALSIFLPLTFWWDPKLAMYFFAGIIGSAGNGGSITAILLNMPGTAQNAATMLEGYPMTKRGESVFALNVSASASLLGAFIGLIILVALLPIFSPILLKFGPAETFWIGTFGLVCLIVSVRSGMMKGLIAVGVGMILSIVGLGGPSLPAARMTFGSSYLLDGLNLVVVVIGLLVLSEAFALLVDQRHRRASVSESVVPASADPPGNKALAAVEVLAPGAATQRQGWYPQMKRGLGEPFRHPMTFLRSSALGTFVGTIPGVGGSVAQFMAYNVAQSMSRKPEEYGHGSREGLVATEAAINAKEGGSLFPTFLFGIPGTAEMALVLAAWQIHGMQPGPLFLSNHADLAWALIFGLLIANIVNSAVTVAASPVLSRIPAIDTRLVAPIILVTSSIAVFSIRQNFLDIIAVFAIGLLGFVQKKYGYPVIATVVGFVVGGVIEKNFHFALQTSLGNFQVFINTSISISLALMSALVIAVSIMRHIITMRKSK
jgi:putative tricarboxylic transport membrane protein